jgi:hypothetical protein
VCPYGHSHECGAHLLQAAFSKFIMVPHQAPGCLCGVTLVINRRAELPGIVFALRMQIEVKQPVLLSTLKLPDQSIPAHVAEICLPKVGY